MAGPSDRRPDPAALTRGRVVRGPPRRARGAQDRPRPARTARGRGDRHVHAGPGRGTPAREGRRPVLHDRAAADLLRRHRRRCTASSTWPTPSTSNKPSAASPPSSRSWARRTRSTSAGRPRSASSPAHQLALDLTDSVVEEGAPRPSRNHRPEAAGRPLRPPLPGRPRRHRHRAARAAATSWSPPARSATGAEPPAQITVKPVLDLEAHDPVDYRRRPGPARRGHRGPGQDLRLPLVHPVRPTLRHRPHHPRRPRRTDLSVQSRAALSATSPDQDPRRLDLHHPRTRPLPLDLEARLPVPPRPRRHPRRQPATAAEPPTSYPAPDPAASGAIGTPGRLSGWFRDGCCATSSTTDTPRWLRRAAPPRNPRGPRRAETQRRSSRPARRSGVSRLRRSARLRTSTNGRPRVSPVRLRPTRPPRLTA